VPLPVAPPDLVPTRDALHRVAEHVLAPVRVQATGNEIALEARAGGVGTPDLPGGGWVASSGTDLVVAAADGSRTTTPLTTLRAAGEAAGLRGAAELDGTTVLEIDAAASAFLGEVHAFGTDALTALRDELDPSAPVRLWPEHFDVAIELGDEAAGSRAAYGVSPGDPDHDEPYAYVAPWAAPRGDARLWQATGFAGAEIGWEALAAAADPREVLLDFWRSRAAALRDEE
jgi:hypothetical protein